MQQRNGFSHLPISRYHALHAETLELCFFLLLLLLVLVAYELVAWLPYASDFRSGTSHCTLHTYWLL